MTPTLTCVYLDERRGFRLKLFGNEWKGSLPEFIQIEGMEGVCEVPFKIRGTHYNTGSIYEESLSAWINCHCYRKRGEPMRLLVFLFEKRGDTHVYRYVQLPEYFKVVGKNALTSNPESIYDSWESMMKAIM